MDVGRLISHLNPKYKKQTLRKIDDVEYTEEQWTAIKENGRIHHRDDTYPGLTDSDIFLGHYRLGVFKEDDFLMGRIGNDDPFR